MSNPDRYQTTTGVERSQAWRQSESRRYSEYVIGTAAKGLLYGFLLGFGLFGALSIGVVILEWAPASWWLFGFAVMMGTFFGAVTALYYLEVQRKEWELHNTGHYVKEVSVPVELPVAAKREQPVFVNGVPTYRREDPPLLRWRDDKTGQLHEWQWQGAELDVMLRWWKTGDVRFRRDSDKAAGRNGITDIGRIGKEDYSTIQNVMRGVGLIDDKNYWTASGKLWLETAGLPEGE